jgi:helicase MOV-10
VLGLLIAFSVPASSIVMAPKLKLPPQLCAALKSGKECNNPQCKSSHFFRPCDPCKRLFFSEIDYHSHINSKRHKQREAKSRIPLQPKENKRATELCSVCQIYVKVDDMAKHKMIKPHLRLERFQKLRSLLDEAQKNKNGVIVEGKFDFGVVALREMGSGLERGGTVRVKSSKVNVTLLEASLGSTTKGQKSSYVSICCSNVKNLTINPSSSSFSFNCGGSKKIQYPNPISFTITARQRFNGRSSDILRLLFIDNNSKQKFIITRELRIIVGSKADHENLKASVPYQPVKRGVQHAPVKEVVEGIKPSSFFSIPYRTHLPYAEMPKDLASDLGDSTLQTQDLIQRVKNKHLPSTFNQETYGAYFGHFKTLLWVEEKRQE